MTPIHTIIRGRNDALLRRFREDMLPPHAALMNLSAAPDNPALGGGTLKPLPGRRGPMIWEKATPEDTSLWVPKSYGAYRAAYFDFITEVHGDQIDMAGAEAYDIDHLFNRERASSGAMIRVEAVLSGINRSHGAGYEKTAGDGAVAKSRQANMRPFTKIGFISILKILGLPVPVNANDRPRIDRIRQEAAKLGFPPDVIEDAINNMRDVAQR